MNLKAGNGPGSNGLSADPQLLNSKILIIDDDVSVSMAIEEILREHDYQKVRHLADAREAETVVLDFRPDLILLDINMPHLDGFGVMEKLKNVRADTFIPVIVLTGETDEAMCERALLSGATDFLKKPMNVTEGLARIKNLLETKRLHAQLEDKSEFLEEKVKERTSQLRSAIQRLDGLHSQVKEAYIETIYRLTRATEYKDNETADHVKRLSYYAAALGRAIGLGEPMIELLLYASPMHDIGKIGIPDKILFKNGKLTEGEWKVMREHPRIGHDILKGSQAPVLKLGAIIALHHHERWDGSGYPQGLKGEAIPIEARILALVDVYDALRSKRHYKKPFDHKTACKIILEGDERIKPGYFDPKLLEKFREIHPEFEKIFDENSQ